MRLVAPRARAAPRRAPSTASGRGKRPPAAAPLSFGISLSSDSSGLEVDVGSSSSMSLSSGERTRLGRSVHGVRRRRRAQRGVRRLQRREVRLGLLLASELHPRLVGGGGHARVAVLHGLRRGRSTAPILLGAPASSSTARRRRSGKRPASARSRAPSGAPSRSSPEGAEGLAADLGGLVLQRVASSGSAPSGRLPCAPSFTSRSSPGRARPRSPSAARPRRWTAAPPCPASTTASSAADRTRRPCHRASTPAARGREDLQRLQRGGRLPADGRLRLARELKQRAQRAGIAELRQPASPTQRRVRRAAGHRGQQRLQVRLGERRPGCPNR